MCGVRRQEDNNHTDISLRFVEHNQAVWNICSGIVRSGLFLTSQTESTQAAVRQLDVGRRGQLLAQLHHHTQRGMATEQDHLQVPAEPRSNTQKVIKAVVMATLSHSKPLPGCADS